jgi:hypothetical protein
MRRSSRRILSGLSFLAGLIPLASFNCSQSSPEQVERLASALEGGPPHSTIVVATNCISPGGDAEDCSCGPDAGVGSIAISGGTYAGSPSYMLNASQVGPSYGGSAQTWRVACVEPSTGIRTPCVDPFAVCLSNPAGAAVKVEMSNCVPVGGHVVDCTCGAGEVAISGGAYSAQPNYMLNASQAGPSYGGSARTWRVACVDPTGTRVDCAAPFVVCIGSPYTNLIGIETANCSTGDGDTVDCACKTGVAISGGAYSGQPGNMLNASQAGPSYGGSAQTWRVACVDPTGNRVACAAPFAVCASGF